jgi:alkylhydroperoxidase/carboxymuconolactone decarboxylase family protein YurZ
MNTPTRIEVDAATGEKLTRFALSDPELLLAGLEARANWQETSGLDDRTYSLVKVAALIALDAPPASYVWQVGNAVAAGCTPAELLGVLIAIAPQVGGPRTVAAAPELMVALGLSLPSGVDGEPDEDDGDDEE